MAANENPTPSNVIEPPSGWWGHHHPRHHRRHHRHRAWGPALVRELAAEVADRLDLSEVQGQAWRKVVAVLDDHADSLTRLRTDLGALEGELTAPVRLARAEDSLATGLELARALRPAFEAFYGTLAPGQKRTLDALAERRRRRWHHR